MPVGSKHNDPSAAQREAYERAQALQRAEQAREAAERAAALAKRDASKDAAVQAASKAVEAAKADLYVAVQKDAAMPQATKEKILGVTQAPTEKQDGTEGAASSNTSSQEINDDLAALHDYFSQPTSAGGGGGVAAYEGTQARQVAQDYLAANGIKVAVDLDVAPNLAGSSFTAALAGGATGSKEALGEQLSQIAGNTAQALASNFISQEQSDFINTQLHQVADSYGDAAAYDSSLEMLAGGLLSNGMSKVTDDPKVLADYNAGNPDEAPGGGVLVQGATGPTGEPDSSPEADDGSTKAPSDGSSPAQPTTTAPQPTGSSPEVQDTGPAVRSEVPATAESAAVPTGTPAPQDPDAVATPPTTDGTPPTQPGAPPQDPAAAPAAAPASPLAPGGDVRVPTDADYNAIPKDSEMGQYIRHTDFLDPDQIALAADGAITPEVPLAQSVLNGHLNGVVVGGGTQMLLYQKDGSPKLFDNKTGAELTSTVPELSKKGEAWTNFSLADGTRVDYTNNGLVITGGNTVATANYGTPAVVNNKAPSAAAPTDGTAAVAPTDGAATPTAVESLDGSVNYDPAVDNPGFPSGTPVPGPGVALASSASLDALPKDSDFGKAMDAYDPAGDDTNSAAGEHGQLAGRRSSAHDVPNSELLGKVSGQAYAVNGGAQLMVMNGSAQMQLFDAKTGASLQQNLPVQIAGSTPRGTTVLQDGTRIDFKGTAGTTFVSGNTLTTYKDGKTSTVTDPVAVRNYLSSNARNPYNDSVQMADGSFAQTNGYKEIDGKLTLQWKKADNVSAHSSDEANSYDPALTAAFNGTEPVDGVVTKEQTFALNPGFKDYTPAMAPPPVGADAETTQKAIEANMQTAMNMGWDEKTVGNPILTAAEWKKKQAQVAGEVILNVVGFLPIGAVMGPAMRIALKPVAEAFGTVGEGGKVALGATVKAAWGHGSDSVGALFGRIPRRTADDAADSSSAAAAGAKPTSTTVPNPSETSGASAASSGERTAASAKEASPPAEAPAPNTTAVANQAAPEPVPTAKPEAGQTAANAPEASGAPIAAAPKAKEAAPAPISAPEQVSAQGQKTGGVGASDPTPPIAPTPAIGKVPVPVASLPKAHVIPNRDAFGSVYASIRKEAGTNEVPPAVREVETRLMQNFEQGRTGLDDSKKLLQESAETLQKAGYTQSAQNAARMAEQVTGDVAAVSTQAKQILAQLDKGALTPAEAQFVTKAQARLEQAGTQSADAVSKELDLMVRAARDPRRIEANNILSAERPLKYKLDQLRELRESTSNDPAFTEQIDQATAKLTQARKDTALLSPSSPPLSTAEQATKRQAIAANSLQAKQIFAGNKPLEKLADDLADVNARLRPTNVQQRNGTSALAFESVLAKNLVEQAPAATRATWTQFSSHGFRYLQSLPAEVRQRSVTNLHKRMAADSRGWENKVPQSQAFVAAKTPEQQMKALEQLMTSPAEDGYNMIAKVKVMRDLSLSMREADKSAAPWHSKQTITNKDGSVVQDLGADGFNGQVLMPQRGRMRFGVEDRNATGGKDQFVGLTSKHQKGVLDESQTLSERPSVHYRVDADNPSLQKFMDDGNTSGSGISGSTNILVYWLDAAARNGFNFDRAEFVKGAAAFMARDGGHTIEEVLWAVNNSASGRMAISQADAPGANSLERFHSLGQKDPAMDKIFDDAWKEYAEHMQGYAV